MHLAVALGITHRLLPALNGLRDALLEKSTHFRDVIKVGRTHLQDAAPLTLGQEMSGYACQLEAARAFIEAAMPAICQLAIGGSAVGTGLNAHPEFGTRVAQRLAEQTGLPFLSAPNKFAVMAAHDALVNVHGALRTLAVALTKIANDLRWLASGPRAGLGEISLPSNEPGSSMMPGKTNPTQCESLLMISCQVMANDVAMSLAGSAGNFQLNAHKPLMALALTQSIRVLTQGMLNFNRYCVAGIEANRERIAQHLSQSLMLATALSPHLGYDRVGELVSRAHNANTTLREEAVASGWVSPEQFDLWVDPTRMV
jgi:fumarate hydratase class II